MKLSAFISFQWMLSNIVALPMALADPIPSAYSQIAHQLGVPPDILYAVALAESGVTYHSRFRPWPWTLNIEGRGYRFVSRYLAYQTLKTAIAQQQSVDVGLLQINRYWHGNKFSSDWASLDPVTNVMTGAGILLGHYQKTQDWWLAVEKYHAPGKNKHSRQRAIQYRKRVYQLWQQIKRSQ